MHPCPECGDEYSSPLAAEDCGERDLTEAARQRRWTKAHEIQHGQLHDRANQSSTTIKSAPGPNRLRT